MKRKRKRPKNHKIILEEGKFYNVHEGSKTGHTGRIEKADYINDEYLCITTHSLTKEEYEEKKKNNTFRKDYVELEVSTSKSVYKSLINKRPFLGGRDDYGDKEFSDMSISKKDSKKVQYVLARTPRLGYWYKRRNKKAFK